MAVLLDGIRESQHLVISLVEYIGGRVQYRPQRTDQIVIDVSRHRTVRVAAFTIALDLVSEGFEPFDEAGAVVDQCELLSRGSHPRPQNPLWHGED